MTAPEKLGPEINLFFAGNFVSRRSSKGAWGVPFKHIYFPPLGGIRRECFAQINIT